jgi:hypothetical protein
MSDNTRKTNVPWTGRFTRRGFDFRMSRMAHSQTDLADRIAAGGARRDRTDDLLLAKQALSQLSYGPAPVDARIRRGFGGQPSRFEGWLANRSCLGREGWWAWEDLNFRPHAYQARALTS